MSFPWIITEHIVKTKRAMALGPSTASSKGAGGGEGASAADGASKGVAVAGDSDGPLTPYGNKKTKKKGKGGGDGGMGHVLVEEMLWALDLYNDAAHRALYVLNSQYLFNEIQVAFWEGEGARGAEGGVSRCNWRGEGLVKVGLCLGVLNTFCVELDGAFVKRRMLAP